MQAYRVWMRGHKVLLLEAAFGAVENCLILILSKDFSIRPPLAGLTRRILCENSFSDVNQRKKNNEANNL